MKFKATARRNKLLGLWAAQKMGKSGDAAEEYAAALVTTGLVGVGADLIFKKLRADFDAARVPVVRSRDPPPDGRALGEGDGRGHGLGAEA